MLLFLKISKQQLLDYRKEFLECLKQNSYLTTIKEIFVFTDEIDHNIENFQNKIKVIYRRNLDDLEILKYTISKSNRQFIIKSNTFVKILEELTEINKSDLEKYIIESKGIQIFSKKTKISPINNLLEKQVKYLPIKTSKIETKSINKNIIKEKKLDNLTNIKKAKLIKPTELVREKKLDVIIISVNYNDYLLTSLSYNTKLFENITVVTSEEDIICQKICESFGVNCVITDIMFENGSSFNKGKAINFGLNSIDNPDMILLLDADIIVNQKIDINNLSEHGLYTSSRIMINDYQSLLDFDKGKRDFDYENDKGLGFFQLFCYNNPVIDKEEVYPEFSNDASWSDLTFRDRFTFRECINLEVIHLGEAYQNWEGRITQRFLTNKEFGEILKRNTFDINEYFDNIYCLNLDRRTDRWGKVSKEFEKFNIEVERFSAIDGDDLEFESISKEIQNLSNEGLIENKYALACLRSHREIIKDAKSKGYGRILIFEDDIIFSEDFRKKIKKIVDIDWNLTYLGSSQFNWNNIEYQSNFYLSKKTLGTFAYAIHECLFDEIIDILSKEIKSVDNSLEIIQDSNYGKCFTFYPNIVTSQVKDSDIRDPKDYKEYSSIVKWNKKNKFKILLLPDVEGWAFDNICKSIIKYNPIPNEIEYHVNYIRDIQLGNLKIDTEEWDLVYVMFEAEQLIRNTKNVIRGCYSAFWLEDINFTKERISTDFTECRASIYANLFLEKSIKKYLPEDHKTIVITDSSNEEIFYPIKNLRNKEFTVIFVGNTKRKIKNFQEIKWICEQAQVDLLVCENINNNELVNYYNKADICINFSTFEGGPQTFIESSLCAVPMLIRSNNELSKLIPCFKGETREDFVEIINELKKNRKKCRTIGEKAREVALKDFTYKKTAEKFANFFKEILDTEDKLRKDLRKELTVFLISCGENPNYQDCLESLQKQSVKFNLKEIKNISPMSKAFQKMIDDCETDFYIQVDEDMILFEDSIEKIYNNLLSSKKNICIISHLLNDVHLNFDIHGIKGYKHKILKNYPYNLNIISCEMEQIERLKNDGFEIDMIESVLGLHSPKWTNELIFERYFDLMEKWKKYKYWWMEQVPNKLMNKYKEDPSEINLFALSGALSSISNPELLRNREKNFEIKDDNFDRIKKMLKL